MIRLHEHNITEHYLSLVAEDVPDPVIADLSQRMPNQWNLVGTYLGLQNDHIDTLDAEHNSIADKTVAMLHAWKRKMGKSATRSNLMKALVKAKRGDLAEEVRTFKGQ